ncbi:hypothetical protein HGRIS_013603 [Hohenbuehelia grisea]|uniref:Uncharacterized protein n=1 Tax=Hohenbuehelia grisea TaxID=104357 RepID=A0ABR3IW84_9AGAR
MSHFIGVPQQDNQAQQRPNMRRKSSAQNLLSSFKTANAQSTSQTSSTGTVSSATGLAYISASMPTATTPTAREWDAQSLHSDSGPSAPSPANGPGTSPDYLRDLVQKRIITLTYIRNIHEGRSHWFHTILMSGPELEKVFNNTAMRKRTYRFAVLGMSLSNLLDIQQPQDLLRGLLNTLTEYEQAKEDSDKPKMRLFRPKLKRQTVGGFTEYAVSYSDASETSYLVAPHTPFPLDYHQTLLSLLDVLSEVYNKISKILGPSPIPHSSQQMLGPLGLQSGHPGVSYLFPDAENSSGLANGAATATAGGGPSNGAMGNAAAGNVNAGATGANSKLNPGGGAVLTDAQLASLWGIANASVGTGGAAGAFMYGGAMSSPPASWQSSYADLVLKIDGKFKKITSALLKELDAFARNGIKDELASLDPLLRNMTVSNGREQYDFDAF